MDAIEILELLVVPGRCVKLYPKVSPSGNYWTLGAEITTLLDAVMQRGKRLVLSYEADEDGTPYIKITSEDRHD